MNKTMKRCIACFAISVMLLSMTGYAYPDNGNKTQNSRSERILTYLEEYNEVKDHLARATNLNERIQFQKALRACVNNLNALGAEILTHEEVYKEFGNCKNLKGENSFPYEELSQEDRSITATVTWVTFNESESYGGETYTIRKLVAAGNEPGGMLVQEGAYTFFSGLNLAISGLSTAGTAKVQKATGSTTVLTWTPTIQFPSYNSASRVHSMSMDYTCKSRIMFTYVKKNGYDEALCFYSNGLDLTINLRDYWTHNNTSDYYGVSKSIRTNATYYNSNVAAIQAYEGIAGTYDYMPGFTVYAYNQSYSKYISVPNPLVGPGQIY